MPLLKSHVAYLEKFWEEEQYPKKYFHNGLLGTLLPDIRYLNKQSRELTHLENFSFSSKLIFSVYFDLLFKKAKEIFFTGHSIDEAEKYFLRGFVFHIILDKWWAKQIYFGSNFKYFGLCLKIVNDLILDFKAYHYDMKYNTQRINLLTLEIDQYSLDRWYSFVFKYLNTELTVDKIENIISNFGLFERQVVIKISDEVRRILGNEEIISKLKLTSDNFSWRSISKDRV